MKKLIKYIAPVLLILYSNTSLAVVIPPATDVIFNGPALNAVDEITPSIATLTVANNSLFIDDTLLIAISIGVPFADNLTISIEHGGFSAIIYQGQGNTGAADIDAIFTSPASSAPALTVGPAPTTGAVNGIFASLESLSIFNGLNLQGAWNLSISDQSGNSNDGTDLLAWSVGADIPTPASFALFMIGMVGFSSRKKA